MIAHATDGIGLNDGVDASVMERRDREFGVGPVAVLLGDDEFGTGHESSIRLRLEGGLETCGGPKSSDKSRHSKALADSRLPTMVSGAPACCVAAVGGGASNQLQ